MHVRWYEQDICFVTFANLLSLYCRLALGLALENFSGQKLTNDLYKSLFILRDTEGGGTDTPAYLR